jgi:hypothetical protein
MGSMSVTSTLNSGTSKLVLVFKASSSSSSTLSMTLPLMYSWRATFKASQQHIREVSTLTCWYKVSKECKARFQLASDRWDVTPYTTNVHCDRAHTQQQEPHHQRGARYSGFNNSDADIFSIPPLTYHCTHVHRAPQQNHNQHHNTQHSHHATVHVTTTHLYPPRKGMPLPHNTTQQCTSLYIVHHATMQQHTTGYTTQQHMSTTTHLYLHPGRGAGIPYQTTPPNSVHHYTSSTTQQYSSTLQDTPRSSICQPLPTWISTQGGVQASPYQTIPHKTSHPTTYTHITTPVHTTPDHTTVQPIHHPPVSPPREGCRHSLTKPYHTSHHYTIHTQRHNATPHNTTPHDRIHHTAPYAHLYLHPGRRVGDGRCDEAAQREDAAGHQDERPDAPGPRVVDLCE